MWLEKKQPNTEMYFTHVPRVKHILKPMARGRYCSKFGNIWWQSEVSFPFLIHTQNNTPCFSWEKFHHTYGFHFLHLIFHLTTTIKDQWKPIMYPDLLVPNLAYKKLTVLLWNYTQYVILYYHYIYYCITLYTLYMVDTIYNILYTQCIEHIFCNM